MKNFILKILSGFAIGIGFCFAIVSVYFGYREYYDITNDVNNIKHSKPSSISTPNSEEILETEEIPEYYPNEKLDNIFEKAENYRWGRGVNKNNKEATKWYLVAAEEGHAESQMELAFMYRKGYGVEKDYKETIKWLKESSSQGNARAESNLGWMYRKGFGVEIDNELAFKHFMTSAKNGNAFAMGNIGYMYERGLYVEKSNKFAREWYEKGKLAGDDYSIDKLRDGW